jgi:hypothetical protein
LRSLIAHGRITSIGTEGARAIPGVHAIITAADVPRPIPTVNIRLQPMPSLVPFQQPVLAFEKVRYVGEPIAVVLADSAALAEDAAEVRTVECDRIVSQGVLCTAGDQRNVVRLARMGHRKVLVEPRAIFLQLLHERLFRRNLRTPVLEDDEDDVLDAADRERRHRHPLHLQRRELRAGARDTEQSGQGE